MFLRTSSRILYAILFVFTQASDGLDSALVDMELSSRLQNCSTSISDKVKEYFNTMVENSYFKIISVGKASSYHNNTHIAGLTNTNYPSNSLTFSQTVQYVNLAVGLILVVALLVGFCHRHKWTKGKSIFGHLIKNLMKGKVFVLLGKAKGKRCHGSDNLGKSTLKLEEDDIDQCNDKKRTDQHKDTNGSDHEIVVDVELSESPDQEAKTKQTGGETSEKVSTEETCQV